ncbi:MAG: DUF4159 domain-containing protein [Pseudomonadota bacterium]
MNFSNLLRLITTQFLILLFAFTANPVLAQRFPYQSSQPRFEGNTPADPDGAELHFARLVYGEDGGFGGRGRSRNTWTTDWPEAEHFFMEGVTRLTLVDGNAVSVYNGDGGERIDLLEGNIFDFPWLYAVEVGYWTLSTEEAAILREYLLRGGFLMVDDFHGSQEWSGFVATMQKVFPDRPIIDLKSEDEVFHVLYDLDERIQIPGFAALYNGVTYERDGVEPTWRGIYDDEGRLLVAINHNMDLGDAWEQADTPDYPEPMTALAYRFAVNYVIYSMTH